MAKKDGVGNPFVFSTSAGEVCPGCGSARNACNCPPVPPAFTGDGIVRISRETKGRKGAGVTLVSGVPLAGGELEALAKRLKQRCGAGGSIKAGVIEIQGDKRELVREELNKSGFKVKMCGG